MSAPRKNETPLAGGAPKAKHIAVEQRRQFSAKSTATEAQHARILAALRARPTNTYELFRQGVFRVGARIRELRRAGHRILTDRVVVVDADGFRHANVALYSLVEAKR